MFLRFWLFFSVALWRVWQTLASLGTCLMETGWPPAPSHLANPGTTSPGPPALAPWTRCQPFPSASCHQPQLPALVTGDWSPWQQFWEHWATRSQREQRREGCPCQPALLGAPLLPGCCVSVETPSCRWWSKRSGWALWFGDFFAFLLPAFIVSHVPSLCPRTPGASGEPSVIHCCQLKTPEFQADSPRVPTGVVTLSKLLNLFGPRFYHL